MNHQTETAPITNTDRGLRQQCALEELLRAQDARLVALWQFNRALEGGPANNPGIAGAAADKAERPRASHPNRASTAARPVRNMSGTLDEHLAAQLEREIMERDLAEIHKRLDEYELDLRSHYPKIEAKDKPETPAAAGLKDNPIKTA